MGSDIRNITLLSNVFNDDTGKNASLEFEGTGSFTIVLNMTADDYGIDYDGLPCKNNSQCVINSNEDGIINLTLTLDGYHCLDVYNTTILNIENNTAAPPSSSIISFGYGSYPTYHPTDENLAAGYEIALAKGFKVSFTACNTSHTLKINSISEDTANLTISSEPVTLILSPGQTAKVDIDSNGFYDISVLVKTITAGKATLIITSIHE